MGRLLVLALAAAFAPTAAARVWTTVYRCDGVTPLEAVDPNRPEVHRDIMVGTRLVVVVSSDVGEYWYGGMLLSHEDLEYGVLSGRDYDKRQLNFEGSCLKAAGRRSQVMYAFDPAGVGFLFTTYYDLAPADWNAAAGDWFILDYHAKQVGCCRIHLYDGSFRVLETHTFNHVPSRDFNGDAVVDLKDFAVMASHWQSTVDPASEGTLDLDMDGRIGISDVALLSEYWLARTDCNEVRAQPNEPVEGPGTTSGPRP